MDSDFWWWWWDIPLDAWVERTSLRIWVPQRPERRLALWCRISARKVVSATSGSAKVAYFGWFSEWNSAPKCAPSVSKNRANTFAVRVNRFGGVNRGKLVIEFRWIFICSNLDSSSETRKIFAHLHVRELLRGPELVLVVAELRTLERFEALSGFRPWYVYAYFAWSGVLRDVVRNQKIPVWCDAKKESVSICGLVVERKHRSIYRYLPVVPSGCGKLIRNGNVGEA